MNFLLYFLLLLLTWGYTFLISLHINWGFLFPSYKTAGNVKELRNVEEIYDYVIVGAGTAGSVIAHRLSQNTSLKILLIEAGPLGSPLLDIPGGLAFLQLSPVDWQYKTTSQTHAALSLQDSRSNWPRGKIVGGSGRLNNMMFVRGHPQDYFGWFPEGSRLRHFENAQHFLKYYWKRSETQKGRYENDTEFHGKHGPLIATDEYFHSKLSKTFEEASGDLKIPKRDLNAFYTGFDHPQVNIKNGARYSTGHFLIERLNDKPNLDLVIDTEVWKVNFLDDYEAKSVEAVSQKTGEVKEISARYGVILSCGTINTPKLLQLSGIGDPEHLKPLGISPIVNLPEVGQNLQDHIGAGLDLVTLDETLELSAASLLTLQTSLDYWLSGTGPLTTIESEGMIIGHIDCLINKTDFQTCHDQLREVAPDFQFMATPLGITTDLGVHLYNIIGLDRSVYDEYYQDLHGKTVIMLISLILHPKSRGYVMIDSKDASRAPVINPNYLQHPDDVQVVLKGIRFAQEVVQTPAFQELGARIDPRPFPACREHARDSDDYWICFIRHTTLTIYHPIGTAALGTVLDYNFRVKGTSKLFVADASAMPDLTSGNTNAMVATLAEVAADYIKHEFWLLTNTCDIRDVFMSNKSLFYV